MKYYEITPESPAYEMCVKVWGVHDVWKNAETELKELVGAENIEKIIMNTKVLTMDVVPVELKGQFYKTMKHGGYPAKPKSEVNLNFLKIVEKYSLYYNGASDIALILGTLFSRGAELYHPQMNGKYYFETAREIKEFKGLVEISEPEFLRMRADWLESHTK